jgi:hypothetical protein
MSDIPFINSPKALGMNDALSIMNKYGGLAKSCRFAVRINRPQFLASLGASSASKNVLGDFTYLCEAAEMPGRGFVNADVRYYGPNQKLPVLTQYEDTTLTFVCRNEGYERQFFDDWMEYINPTNSFNFNFRKEYETTVEIMQFAEYAKSLNTGPNRGLANQPVEPQETYRITLFNAFPLLVNPQPMTWADDQLMRLAVTFTYHKWQRVGLDRAPRSGNGLLGDANRGPNSAGVTTQNGILTKINYRI